MVDSDEVARLTQGRVFVDGYEREVKPRKLSYGGHSNCKFCDSPTTSGVSYCSELCRKRDQLLDLTGAVAYDEAILKVKKLYPSVATEEEVFQLNGIG